MDFALFFILKLLFLKADSRSCEYFLWSILVSDQALRLSGSNLDLVLVIQMSGVILFEKRHNNPEACASTPTTGRPSYKLGKQKTSITE